MVFGFYFDGVTVKTGNYVYISATGTRYCPVSVLRKYMDVAGIDVYSNLPLFRPFVYHGSSTTYTLRGGKISYTSCREILRDTLKNLGFDPDDYGFHSLRSGGITSVVHNSSSSVPERLLKPHSRWKTDAANVEESLEKQLQVTKRLGLQLPYLLFLCNRLHN